MNVDQIKCIEEKMRSEALHMVADERLALDQVDSSTRAQITNILGSRTLFIDIWLISPCSYLEGKRPLDVLKISPSEVITAAIRKKNWESPG